MLLAARNAYRIPSLQQSSGDRESTLRLQLAANSANYRLGCNLVLPRHICWEVKLSESAETAALPKLKVPRRPRRLPNGPSPGAQRFLDAMTPRATTIHAIRAQLEPWLKNKGINWRSVGEYLSGKAPHCSHDALLAEFVREQTGEKHDPREFKNLSGVRNFAGEFCARNVASTSLLRAVCGKYVCLRPGIDVLNGAALSFGPEDEKHKLELLDHGDFQPGTFSYKSTTAAGDDLGEWAGYAVTKVPYIFLCGFCVDGEDASYFLLRQHPAIAYSAKMLVGIQSLLLPHPQPRDAKHAVSRHIVAIKKEFTASAEAREAARQWIQTNLQKSGGLLVDLGDRPSIKT
jgi:hypothetical protein